MNFKFLTHYLFRPVTKSKQNSLRIIVSTRHSFQLHGLFNREKINVWQTAINRDKENFDEMQIKNPKK